MAVSNIQRLEKVSWGRYTSRGKTGERKSLKNSYIKDETDVYVNYIPADEIKRGLLKAVENIKAEKIKAMVL